ncbi:DUF2793 domain-containing protein [Gemmobacter sp. JM10B15]|uniref:DUF2793 domain-containing protein n=1 Tax=Gemmobacter denitrificans TaxID=3123040 RepID=A0ABU8C1F9_9RHOB
MARSGRLGLRRWPTGPGRLAARLGGAWVFIDPREGWRAWSLAEAQLRIWRGTEWQALPLDQLDGIGIGTAHDGTNRLAVVSPATLLTHDGAGHQLKINKAAEGDTASLLYQTNWSGRAEMGLAGNDDFSVKVSADGGTWAEALRINRSTGAAALLAGATVDGQAAYHRGNVVGSVGQSGGLPTGAVIETGSNANGRYLRLADGTQICWREAALSQSVAASSYAEVTWTYPAAFLSGTVPVPMVTCRSFNDAASRQNAARHLRAVCNGNSAVSSVVGAFNAHTAALDTRIDAVVSGRWF